MKQLLFIPAIILYCIVFSTASSAQTVPIKGGSRLEFAVTGGKIVLYLPDDIRAGEMISGTVVAVPAGSTPEEISSNLKLLQKQKYKVDAGGIIITDISAQYQPLQFKMAESNFTVTVMDRKNNTINSIPVVALNSIPQPPGPVTVPTHALTIGPVRITGPFDGNIGTTKCRIDGNEMPILAESPRQTIFYLPQMPAGKHTITIEENGITTEKKMNAVDMTFDISKTALLKGEKTSLTVNITGLQDLPSDAQLVITNLSSAVVTLSGGNTQAFTITPSQVKDNGIFNQTFYGQSIITGDFSVNADLQLPESGQSTITSLEIILPSPTPAGTAAWSNAPPPFNITAQATLVNGQVTDNVNGKILVFIKNDTSKICGTYTQQTAPPGNFTTATKTWGGQEALALLGQDCELPPGNYELCVQLYSKIMAMSTGFGGGQLLKEACKPFTIDTIKKIYSPPVNEFPVDGKVFTKEDSAKPVMFRWIPVLPRPSEDVVYKIKVVELGVGMSATDAMRTGKTLFEREVRNETQLLFDGDVTVAWPIASDSKYLWNVQATGAGGRDYGQSQYFTIGSVGGLGGPGPILIPCIWTCPDSSFSSCKNDKDEYTIPAAAAIGGNSCFNPIISYSINKGSLIPYIGTSITVTLIPGKYEIVFSSSLSKWEPCTVTVNIFPKLNVIIDKQSICNGEAATVSLSPFPSGYSIAWEFSDDNVNWFSADMSGSSANTNPITVSCPPKINSVTHSSTFIERTYRPVIIGEPAWPEGCIDQQPSLMVYCPTEAGTITGAENFCIPPPPNKTTLDLKYEGGNYSNIEWTNPSGQVIGNNSSVIINTPTTAGTYEYTAKVHNGPCSEITTPVTITIEEKIEGVTLTCDKTDVCPNDAAVLTLTPSPSKPLPAGALISWKYQIDCKGDWVTTGVLGLTQNTNNIGNLGPYPIWPTESICWQAEISSGTEICSTNLILTHEIDIIKPPCCPTITKKAGQNPKCPGTSVELEATFPCNTTGLTWTWFCNGVTTNQHGMTCDAITPGNYTIVVSNGCPATCTSAPFTVTDCIYSLTIKDPPCSVPRTSLGFDLCAELSSSSPLCTGTFSPDYLWTVGLNSLPSQKNPCLHVNPTQTTTYAVRVNGMGCPPTTLMAEITVRVCN